MTHGDMILVGILAVLFVLLFRWMAKEMGTIEAAIIFGIATCAALVVGIIMNSLSRGY